MKKESKSGEGPAISRREFVKKAAYVVPAIATIALFSTWKEANAAGKKAGSSSSGVSRAQAESVHRVAAEALAKARC